MSISSQDRQHILTVLLEDYFHVGAFNGLIERDKWYRFEPRFKENTLKTLDLLDRFQIRATFFVLGWIADKEPDLVREVARRGHEIGSRGYYHRSLAQMSSEEFRRDLGRSREALERATGKQIHGYRAARRLTLPMDTWALDVLAEEGYKYDSSVLPTFRSLRANPKQRFAYQHEADGRKLWEFPVPTNSIFGVPVPILGGNYSRQLPHFALKRLVRDWNARHDAPLVMYFHVWELDPAQPKISSASPVARLRHYRGLEKMEGLLEEYFTAYRFAGCADYLGLRETPSESSLEVSSKLVPQIGPDVITERSIQNQSIEKRVPVTIVVPCYNEESTLPYLSNTLKSVLDRLGQSFDVSILFVDDHSTDDSRAKLQELFANWKNCRIVSHETNRGVAAAILTGITNSSTEIVCSMDCDCTYDPHELAAMIPKLVDGVDLVTASPYHPLGQVRNVPGWRLGLSKTASWLYSLVLRQKLYTYTSCFRVYRKSVVSGLKLDEGGFLGVAEMAGRLDLQGSKIVEHPATLEIRLFGHSKMKTLKTIGGHLRLLGRLLSERLRSTAKNKRNLPKTGESIESTSQLKFRH